MTNGDESLPTSVSNVLTESTDKEGDKEGDTEGDTAHGNNTVYGHQENGSVRIDPNGDTPRRCGHYFPYSL